MSKTDTAAEDYIWGREAGATPPLPWQAPLAFVGFFGALLVVVVLALVRTPGPRDEHTFADQRNGLLAHGPRVPAVVNGVRFGHRPVVLLFVRTLPDAPDVTAWRHALPEQSRVLVVVQGPLPAIARQPGFVVVNDPGRVLAATVDLPVPNDQGPGVGYAVVDSQRIVQYATLDPSWRGNGFEVATIFGAIS